MVSGNISFQLKNDTSELSALCDRLEAFCGTIGLNRKNLFEINLALDELFTNIVSYGYTDQREHFVSIDVSCREGVLTIRIEDDGQPFDPTMVDSPDVRCILEDRDIGGLGIFLIKKVMDSITYQRVNGKNVIILKKAVDCRRYDESCGDRR